MSTTQQRDVPASGKLSTVRGLSQAHGRSSSRRRLIERTPSRSPAVTAALPALVKRVQSYLEVGRT